MRQSHSVSTLINRMITAGLTKKEKRPQTKKHLISLTEEGVALYYGLTMISLEMIFSAFTSRESRRFAMILTKLLKRNRQILGVSSHPVFMQYLNQESVLSGKR